MPYSPVRHHMLNKTSSLVDTGSPAEVRDNGAPCLLPSPRAKRPCQALWWKHGARPNAVAGRAPWHHILARTIFFTSLLGKLQWLISYSSSSTVGSFFFFLLMCWSAKLWVVCWTMCSARGTDGCFSSSWWRAKVKFYHSNFSLQHFIWNGCFNSYSATRQLHCISFCIGYDFTTNLVSSS